MSLDPMAIVALTAAGAALVIILVYLLRGPALDLRVKLWLLLGLGVLPAISAASSTATGMQRTTARSFCGSCHVMDAHFQDAATPESQSLAARHSRNPFFGDRSCYVCHADYGMLGYVMTKQNGMRHVYGYYLGGYKQMTLEEALEKLHLFKPYDNANCRQCHTTTLHDWRRVPEHESLKAELDDNRVSCASAGCHGYAHPFTKAETGTTPHAAAAPGPEISP
jgi:nitrate/TMAO reductase-like tetraheme cytochrome c subunit